MNKASINVDLTNEKELAKQLLRQCNYIRSSKRNISLDHHSSNQSISQYQLKKREMVRDISQYKNIREENNKTLIFNTSQIKLDPYDLRSLSGNGNLNLSTIDQSKFRIKNQSKL